MFLRLEGLEEKPKAQHKECKAQCPTDLQTRHVSNPKLPERSPQPCECQGHMHHRHMPILSVDCNGFKRTKRVTALETLEFRMTPSETVKYQKISRPMI